MPGAGSLGRGGPGARAGPGASEQQGFPRAWKQGPGMASSACQSSHSVGDVMGASGKHTPSPVGSPDRNHDKAPMLLAGHSLSGAPLCLTRAADSGSGALWARGAGGDIAWALQTYSRL